jgi:hypothetical protein
MELRTASNANVENRLLQGKSFVNLLKSEVVLCCDDNSVVVWPCTLPRNGLVCPGFASESWCMKSLTRTFRSIWG